MPGPHKKSANPCCWLTHSACWLAQGVVYFTCTQCTNFTWCTCTKRYHANVCMPWTCSLLCHTANISPPPTVPLRCCHLGQRDCKFASFVLIHLLIFILDWREKYIGHAFWTRTGTTLGYIQRTQGHQECLPPPSKFSGFSPIPCSIHSQWTSFYLWFSFAQFFDRQLVKAKSFASFFGGWVIYSFGFWDTHLSLFRNPPAYTEAAGGLHSTGTDLECPARLRPFFSSISSFLVAPTTFSSAASSFNIPPAQFQICSHSQYHSIKQTDPCQDGHGVQQSSPSSSLFACLIISYNWGLVLMHRQKTPLGAMEAIATGSQISWIYSTTIASTLSTNSSTGTTKC